MRDLGLRANQFPFKNIDRELRARVTKSNLFVICLLVQFRREMARNSQEECEVTRCK